MRHLPFPVPESVIRANNAEWIASMRQGVATSDAVLVGELRRELGAAESELADTKRDLAESRERPQLKAVCEITDADASVGDILRIVAALEAAGHDVRLGRVIGNYADNPTIGVLVAIVVHETAGVSAAVSAGV